MCICMCMCMWMWICVHIHTFLYVYVNDYVLFAMYCGIMANVGCGGLWKTLLCSLASIGILNCQGIHYNWHCRGTWFFVPLCIEHCGYLWSCRLVKWQFLANSNNNSSNEKIATAILFGIKSGRNCENFNPLLVNAFVAKCNCKNIPFERFQLLFANSFNSV